MSLNQRCFRGNIMKIPEQEATRILIAVVVSSAQQVSPARIAPQYNSPCKCHGSTECYISFVDRTSSCNDSWCNIIFTSKLEVSLAK